MRVFITLFCLLFVTAAATGEENVRLEPLMPGVWMHVSYNDYKGSRISANGLVVQEGDTLFLIDSAWGDENTKTLLELIEREIGLPVYSAVATHFHEDRTAGARLMQERGIPFFASAATRRLTEAAGATPPAQTLDISERARGRTVLGPMVILYPGAGHTEDNLVVWLPDHKIIFGGCAVRAAGSKNLGNYADGKPEEWDDAMDRVIAAFPDATMVVPGHGAVGGPDLLRHTRALALAHVAKEKVEK